MIKLLGLGILALLVIGIIAVYGWICTLLYRVKKPEPGKLTQGRVKLLIKALDRQDFFTQAPNQTSRRMIENSLLSDVIADMSQDAEFFFLITEEGLVIDRNPNKSRFRYLLCSDYACIGFNAERIKR